MFRYFRLISVLMILAIATSPALAANCVTSCASKLFMTAVNDVDMSNMPNCHNDTMKKDQFLPNIGHKSCSMGTGCNFSQAIPIDLSSKFTLNNLTSASFTTFKSTEKSADLLPPVKPPA